MPKRHFDYVCPNIVIKPTISLCNDKPLCKKPKLDYNIQDEHQLKVASQINLSDVTGQATSPNLTPTKVNEYSTEPIVVKNIKQNSPGEDLNSNCSYAQDLNRTTKKSDVSWASNYLRSVGEASQKPLKLKLSLLRKRKYNRTKKPTYFTRNMECWEDKAALLQPRPSETLTSVGSSETEFPNPIQSNEQKNIGTAFENIQLLEPNLIPNSSIITMKQNSILLSKDSSRTFEEEPMMSLNYVQEPIIAFHTPKDPLIASTARTFADQPISSNNVQEPKNVYNHKCNQSEDPNHYKFNDFKKDTNSPNTSKCYTSTKEEDSILSRKSSITFTEEVKTSSNCCQQPIFEFHTPNRLEDPHHSKFYRFEKDFNRYDSEKCDEIKNCTIRDDSYRLKLSPAHSKKCNEIKNSTIRDASYRLKLSPARSEKCNEIIKNSTIRDASYRLKLSPARSKKCNEIIKNSTIRDDSYRLKLSPARSKKCNEIKNSTIRDASYRSKLSSARCNKNKIKASYRPTYESTRTRHDLGRDGYCEYKYDENTSKPYVSIHIPSKYKWIKPQKDTNIREYIKSPSVSEDIKKSDGNQVKLKNIVAKNMNTHKKTRKSDKNGLGKGYQTTDHYKKTNKLKNSRVTENESKPKKVDVKSKQKPNTKTQNNTECKRKTDSKLHSPSSSISILSPCSSKSNNEFALNSCESKQHRVYSQSDFVVCAKQSPPLIKSIVKVKKNMEFKKSTIDTFDLRSKLSLRSLNHYFTKLRNTNVDSEMNGNNQMERENLIITVDNTPENNNVRPKEVEETDNVVSQSENTVKYKEIQVVINLIYEKSEVDTENESNDNETESCHEDISFLDDINIDDIVESLCKCGSGADFNNDIAEISDDVSVVAIENDNSRINDAASTISISDSIEVIEDNLLDFHCQDTMDLKVPNENGSPKNIGSENNGAIEQYHRALIPEFTKQNNKVEILPPVNTIYGEDTKIDAHKISTQNVILKICQPTKVMMNPIESKVTEHDELAIKNSVVCGPIEVMGNNIITKAIEQRDTIISQQHIESIADLEKGITEKDQLGIQNGTQILASSITSEVTEKDELETQISIISQPVQAMVYSIKTDLIDEIETPNTIICQILNTNKTETIEEQTANRNATSQKSESKIGHPDEEIQKKCGKGKENVQGRKVTQHLEKIDESVDDISLVNVKIESGNETNSKRAENVNTKIVTNKTEPNQNEDTMEGKAVQRVLHSTDTMMKTENDITEHNSDISNNNYSMITDSFSSLKSEVHTHSDISTDINISENANGSSMPKAIKLKDLVSNNNMSMIADNSSLNASIKPSVQNNDDSSLSANISEINKSRKAIVLKSETNKSRSDSPDEVKDTSTKNIKPNVGNIKAQKCKTVSSKGPNKDLMEMLEERMSLYKKDSYSVLTLLHTGKFSTIYRCKDSKGKDYAAKLIKRETNQSRAGLHIENMLTKLQHDIPQDNFNCVYIFDGFGFGEKWCILTEYYPNTLEQVLEDSETPLHIDAIQQLSRQLIRGLVVLRNNNVVHSDLKPSHILINAFNDRLKICGFDEAYYLKDTFLLPPNVGSISYRAPEIILGHSCGFSIDVWATGLIMYEMAAGCKLFSGKYNNEILYEQMCTLGDMPMNMIKTSRYKNNHFDGKRFMKRSGSKGQNVTMINEFQRSNRLRNTICEAFHTHWASYRTAQHKTQDIGKTELFITLLVRMLALDPNCRLTIEFVFAHPFVLS